MSLRSPRGALTRLAITTAAGALLASVCATPALADGEGDHGGNQTADRDDGWGGGGGGGQTSGGNDGWSGGGGNGQTSGGNDGWSGGGGNGQTSGGNDGWSGGGGNGQTSGGNDGWSGGGGNGDQQDQRLYRGVVTASELFLRSAPTRGSQVIRVAHRGERVSIFCKTTGQNIQGNHLWYLLTDGTWAWGSARYIDTFGPTPRWC
ncbi:SH3 domain-containing protein [Streptomyces sp. SLBN-31]|uniref:SH3 domain-containing protein n=1 Tax=Streptomyces sp. SLBN-31 TaxID=2768444 RepID=UPI00114E4B83|nr:SH3 domain-containing protein [Streptomyces sp. SLBN-31]TQJ89962.1 SH3 domain-containing protein [Streptomyces sp. SLBN-31]